MTDARSARSPCGGLALLAPALLLGGSGAVGAACMGTDVGSEGAETRYVPRRERIQVAFAIWNGAAGDSRGRKSISIWQLLDIEPNPLLPMERQP